MKKNILSCILFVLFAFFSNGGSFATNYTWTGNKSNLFNKDSNWTPIGIPGTVDNITIVTGANTVSLSSNVSVANFAMTSGSFNLQGYNFTATGTATVSGGTLSNGKFYIRS